MRTMHANSLAAYHECGEQFSERERLIITAVRELRTATDRQIMAHLGYMDPNAVRPRVTELIQGGVLIECGDTIDAATGKTVRLVRIQAAQGEFRLVESENGRRCE